MPDNTPPFSAVAAAIGSEVLPAIAVHTCHTPGEGMHEPAAWTTPLRDLHRTPSGEPIPSRTVLADRSLAGLPAAIAAWGAERVAVGAVVTLPYPVADEPDVLLLAPGPDGYRALCRLLSSIAEQPAALSRWLGDGLAPPVAKHGPGLSGLIALVRDRTLATALAEVGA